MKMLIMAYQKEAAKTINYALPYEMRLMEMGLGICGEVGELIKIINSPMSRMESRRQVKNEAGDINWYAAALCTLVGHEFSDVFPDEMQPYPPGVASDRIVIAAAEIADAIKKTVAQGHQLDINMILDHLQNLVSNLAVLLEFYGFEYTEVLTENIEKLRRRYPNGFETARSINR